jgi:sugar phosphate isomerase/epimerase
MMRIGTSSYIYPANIITNVRRLAGRVRDLELVLFEVNDPRWDLPNRAVIQELRQIALNNSSTYTVHLPLSLGLAGNQPNLDLARRVIAGTLDLDPYAFIIHVEDGPWKESNKLETWVENSKKSLELIGEEIGVLERICVENLEDQPSSLMDSILASLPVSCCVDIGHLWKQGLDPLPYLKSWLPRMRVAHIHGVGRRDHQKLSVMPESKLSPVISFLRKNFHGVVTIEVFNETDLAESLVVLQRS